MVARKHLLDGLRVHFDPGNSIRQRRRLDVEEPDCGRANENDPARNLARLEVRRENATCRDCAALIGRRQAQPQFAARIGRQDGCPCAHYLDAGVLPESSKTAAAGRLDEDRRPPLRNPQRFERQRGIEPAIDRDEKRHPPHDLVAFRNPVCGAQAVSTVAQTCDVCDAALEGWHETFRRIASLGETGLHLSGQPFGRVFTSER